MPVCLSACQNPSICNVQNGARTPEKEKDEEEMMMMEGEGDPTDRPVVMPSGFPRKKRKKKKKEKRTFAKAHLNRSSTTHFQQ